MMLRGSEQWIEKQRRYSEGRGRAQIAQLQNSKEQKRGEQSRTEQNRVTEEEKGRDDCRAKTGRGEMRRELKAIGAVQQIISICVLQIHDALHLHLCYSSLICVCCCFYAGLRKQVSTQWRGRLQQSMQHKNSTI
ncbi:hypothetical protein B484DRAFT_459414, partial [Ochromonadaceae sp. CCMP2298]